jgi:cellobiose-specific phosphotransferase system component IIB
MWYSNYVSLRSIKNLGSLGSKRKIQRKFSIKMNKFMTCRSDLEANFINYLDDHNLVISFDIEPLSVKYRRGTETNDRRYLVDFIVILVNGTSIFIEVKPQSQIKDFEDIKGQYVRSKLNYDLVVIDPSKKYQKEKLNELFEQYSK